LAHWQKILETYYKKNKLPTYFLQAVKRFEKMSDYSGDFLESTGLNIVEDLKQNKSVFVDISGVDDETKTLISTMIFDELYQLHFKGILKGQTEMIIDEAKLIRMERLEAIITEARKRKLALTLAYQFIKQMGNPKVQNDLTQDAIKNAIGHKIMFANGDPEDKEEAETIKNLPKRHFLYSYNGQKTVLKTKDTIAPVRELTYVPKGLEISEIDRKMKRKKDDILQYFTNIETI
jgi:hypothetical protein